MSVARTDRDLAFEDYRVGQRFKSETRAVTEQDLAAFSEVSGDFSAIHVDPDHARAQGFPDVILQGPFGIAAVFGLLHEMGIVERSVIGMLDLDWRFAAPILVGDELSLEVAITRCRRTSKPGRGVVNRHFRLLNQDGVTVQEGTSAVLVAARDGDDLPVHIHTDFCAQGWAEALLPRLASSAEFREATGTFDGAIELASGGQAIQLRLYRGEVLEAARTTPDGPTFAVTGTELAWADLAFAPRNDYIARTMTGAFAARGNMYQYVRLTKAMVVLWDCIRALAREEAAR